MDRARLRRHVRLAPDACDGRSDPPRLRKAEKELRSGKALQDLIGQEFYGEYLAKTDPLGADVPNPVSHVAYGLSLIHI